ncbi:alpha-L-fucosidase, partial [bacterium]|nr:alpha-L-fucosidase [bacterium]
MRKWNAVTAWLLVFALVASAGFAQASENEKSKEWFQDARFGMFIHWGVYSLLSKGEWVMNNDKITVEEYEKLYPRFNPVNFDAEKWVQIAKDAGMKYITITSKHHDGFSMYDTQLNDYKITNTPFKRDPMKELAAACEKNGLRLFFYYSQLDWHHTDYFPRGKTGQYTGR